MSWRNEKRNSFLEGCAAAGIPAQVLSPAEVFSREPGINPRLKTADAFRLAMSFFAAAKKLGARVDVTPCLPDVDAFRPEDLLFLTRRGTEEYRGRRDGGLLSRHSCHCSLVCPTGVAPAKQIMLLKGTLQTRVRSTSSSGPK